MTTTKNISGKQVAKRNVILAAATSTFARYGYQKTSMDEVARAARASRQGLYLHFPAKEELFRATVEYALSAQFAAARVALEDDGRTLETRLTTACNEWSGRYVGVGNQGAADLIEASTLLTGTLLVEFDQQFEQNLALAIASSPAGAFYGRAGLSSLAVAKNLHATTRGLKHSCESHDAFLEGLRVAVLILIAPIST